MNLIQYLNQKGIVARQKNAAEFCSPCPVCGGKDRFTFWPDRGRYFCRGCNKSGDIIDLLRSVDGLNYAEACNIAGKRVEETDTASRVKARSLTLSGGGKLKEPTGPGRKWQEKAAAFAEWAHGQLLRNPEQLAWLKEVRSIGIETVRRFKLGWNNKDRYHTRTSWDLSEVKKADGKLKSLWLPRGLVIPCHSFSGELLRLKVRRPDSDIRIDTDIRYVFVSGGSAALAFFGHIRSAFIIVESELDAILLHQEGGEIITPVSTGSAMNRPDENAHKILEEADQLLISLDNDRAGEQAALSCWRGIFKNSHFWLIPRKYGKDHTEAKQRGLDLMQWLNCGMQAIIKRSKPRSISGITGVKAPAF